VYITSSSASWNVGYVGLVGGRSVRGGYWGSWRGGGGGMECMWAPISPYRPTHWHRTLVLARTKGHRTVCCFNSSSTSGAGRNGSGLRHIGQRALWCRSETHRQTQARQQRWPLTHVCVSRSTWKLHQTHKQHELLTGCQLVGPRPGGGRKTKTVVIV